MSSGSQKSTVQCAVCKKVKTGKMVQCDACDQWSHFACVGVDDSIADLPWSCEKCNTVMQVSEAVPNKAPSEEDLVSKGGSIMSRNSMRIELQYLEEQRKAEMKYIEKKRTIMLKYVGEDDVKGEGMSEVRTHRTLEWVKKQVGMNNDDSKPNEGCGVQLGGSADRAEAQAVSKVIPALMIEQINARHVVPRDLPIFTGKPEEWPLFYSSFSNSTRLCGFSEDENLLRLQRALKGKALEYVSSRLMIPALVPEIMSTLQMVFGRPEHIINNLITKIRAVYININKLDTIVTFALEVKNLIATMEASELHSPLVNPLLIQELVEKLPPQMRLQWAVASRNINVTLKTFGNWIYELAEAASNVSPVFSAGASVDNERRKAQRINFHEEEPQGAVGDKHKILACFYCKEAHALKKCAKFRTLKTDARWNVVREMRLCGRCLLQHDFRTCKSTRECDIHNCNMKHHPLLHKQTSSTASGANETLAVHHQLTSQALYRIVPVTIYGNGVTCNIYAFLDDGSGPTLIEKDVLRQLRIKGETKDLCLRWTDGTVRKEPDSELVNLQVSKIREGKRYSLCNVRSVAKLELPEQSLNMTELTDKYKHLKGLPVESYQNVRPRMINGLSNKEVAMPMKFREGGKNEPAATKTRLGWTIYGIIKHEPNTIRETLNLHICECDDDLSLQRLVKDFVSNENVIESKKKLENMELEQQRSMQSKISRNGEYFVTRLLWKSNNITMPDNYLMALRRLQCFERKLQSNVTLQSWVCDHIDDMKAKGYKRQLKPNEAEGCYPRKWYLPMFTVSNPNKPQKQRLVWDAAAQYDGVSLNACLEKGPDLLTSLVDVLVNFRIGKIGRSGDIKEMFHRVLVKEEDQHSQRFLWRNCDDSRPPDVYLLQVMSFGATCSPSLAQLVKNSNAREYETEFPRAVKCILQRHYVDDMLDSVDTVEEAINLVNEVRNIHKKANFHIRNWVSNSNAVLKAIGNQGQEFQFCSAGRRIDHTFEAEKVLGIHWQTDTDMLTFDLKFTKATEDVLSGYRLPTKRELLRLMMSIFDPLGMLTFYIIDVKILFQKVWRSGVSWDDAIPNELVDEWNKWLSLLGGVKNVKIPRCYFATVNKDADSIELHVFVDASEVAYAAVVYLRAKNRNNIDVSLICSKAKVAPLRPISIPRLELLAAELGARLGNNIKRAIDLKVTSITYWSDSKAVLSWIKSDPRDYKQFVMFRIAEIQELSEAEQWRYIPTKLNVADLATKQTSNPDFTWKNPWYKGPKFLYEAETCWPNNVGVQKYNEDAEIRKQRLLVAHVAEEEPLIDVYRFSKWERLVRCMAYVKRFMSLLSTNEMKKKKSVNQCLSVEELKWSENFLYQTAQLQDYKKEMTALNRDANITLSKISPLRKLSPFIDAQNVLRLKGRLDKAVCIDDSTKFPIILSRKNYITKLIVDWYHRKWKHLNHETVVNEIFQKYHIPGLRRLLKQVRNNCQHCKVRDASPKPPEMSVLPEARLSAYSRPFSHVGIDYFGPYTVTVGRRSEKRYGVVFTCLTCRAVHLEIAYSLSASSCCIVIRNFIARRGVPNVIYSDNGTNLTAAEKELRESIKNVDFNELQAEFTSPETQWVFLPPAAPHMGGAWERMVRSIKTVLGAIISPQAKINDEKMHNLFCE
ncbi:uncharacterized protein LOC119663485, partial [Teleopsis dalmanni]|uniref:uncharacterized protein LOC119663485 n=1 Tax=Teleopsis dalmanni TaxID=139649 RepID=UPI0018CEC471